MEILKDVESEGTLDLKALSQQPDATAKLIDLAQNGKISVSKKGSEYSIKARQQYIKQLQDSVSLNNLVLVRSLDNDLEMKELFSGTCWGKAGSYEERPIVTALGGLAVFLSQNRQFVLDELKKHDCALKVLGFKGDYVKFSLYGDPGKARRVDKFLRERFFTIFKTVQPIVLVVKVANKAKLLDRVHEKLQPIVSIMCDDTLHLAFPMGEIQSRTALTKQVNEMAHDCGRSKSKMDTDIVAILDQFCIQDEKSTHRKRHYTFPFTSSTYKDLESIRMRFRSNLNRKKKPGIRLHKTYFHTSAKINIHTSDVDSATTRAECIVNAVDGKLRFGAVKISTGTEMAVELTRFIRASGRPKVCDVCVTAADDLPYKMILHAVAPRWNDGNDSVCVNQLQEIYLKCLKEAESLGMKSVAIPALNQEGFGFPQFQVARAVCHALSTFCLLLSHTPAHLKEIFLCNVGKDGLRAYDDAFNEYVRDGAFKMM